MTALKPSPLTRVCLDSEPAFTFTSHMRKTRRYWIEIKDAKGSIVFATAALWDGHNRRAAVAKMLRFDGVLEPPSFPSSVQDVATNIDIESMAASLAIATPAKKTPRN